MYSILTLFFIVFGTAVAAPQGGPLNEYAGKRIPVLYEAYYPEPREWNPEASLQKLRELTSQLVREEEQLSSQIASAGLENVYEPRSQILEYVFSRPAAAAAIAAPAPAPLLLAESNNNNNNNDDEVQVSSLTVSESAPADGHRIRHHHGQANWLMRRLVNTPQNPDAGAPTRR